MALTTNLSVSPYFDDYDENKDFYKILFKPGVSVQTRELNQIQSIFQNQIEKFGDNIFKSGSIISGVNFSFNESYPYVRIEDVDINNVPIIPTEYVGMFISSETSSVKARILESIDGSSTSTPYTKTFYLDYVTGGNDGQTNEFNSGDILTISNANNSLFAIDIINGGSSFSNNDSVIISSSLRVSVANGTFSVGDEILQGNTNSTAIVTDVLTGYFTYEANPAGRNDVILRIKPRTVDLLNTNLLNTPWVFSSSNSTFTGSITVGSNSTIGFVRSSIGRNATAQVITDASGYVLSIPVLNIGYGYTILPNINIKPVKTTAALDVFSALGVNYAAKIKAIASPSVASGFGYSMSVTEGYVYQKGYFVKVNPQSVIVNPYNELGLANNVSVVFQTNESIINSNQDSSLLDNVIGTGNSNAPGADRIKLVPQLIVVSTDEANGSDKYFSLVDFSEGQPFKQNRYTAYNEINNELARRTSDEAGNYVINEFLATTKSNRLANGSSNAAAISVVVDPGKAYISGYRVETTENHYSDINAGINIGYTNDAIVSLNYGNYIRVTEIGGYINFNHGDQVVFSDTPIQFITNNLTTVPSFSGTMIGSASVRSLVLESGTPGTNTAVYRLYLFNTIITAGSNIKDAKSVRYMSGFTRNKDNSPQSTASLAALTDIGVADIVLTPDVVTGANVAIINSPNNSVLIFSSGANTTLQNANNITYIYRTSNTLVSFANTGSLSISYASSSTDKFPYTGSLSSSQMQDLIVVPSTNLISYATVTGGTTIATSTQSNVITGSSATFINDLRVGDYVYLESNTTSANVNASSAVNTSANTIAVSSNPFSNGDYVHYLVATGNTSIGGLSNNAYYYILNSNNTAFQLTSSAGNTIAIDITAGVSETGHQFSTSTQHNDIKKVVLISNNTSVQLNSNVSFSGSTTSLYRVFPQNVSMPFGSRDNMTASVSANAQVLTISTGFSTRASSAATASYNVLRYSSAVGTKQPIRGLKVDLTTKSNPGGVSGPWCLGCPDIFRLRQVLVDNIDKTESFFIDSNQNPDFLDLGFLYLDPKSSLLLLSTSNISVYFDAFVANTAGCFTTQSYVGSNTAQQFLNDSLDLTTLTSNGAINTNEIPEFYSNRNGYFNLLNQIDFRPSVLPTISLSANSYVASDAYYDFAGGTFLTSNGSSIIIRNIDPVNVSVFSNNDIKFPLPGSNLTADISFYLPRIDTITVSKNGKINTLSGSASLKPTSTNIPSDSILIDQLLIPDYPSIPKNPDVKTLEILNTRMQSEKITDARLKNHIVKNQATSKNTRTEIQPRGYSMADIGNLERRIIDLESQVSLSKLENIVSGQIIPSSLTPNIDRFKYGFFVDDFSTTNYSDITNPQYNASRDFQVLYPALENINLPHGNYLNYSLNVTSEQPVVVQGSASYDIAPVPCVLDGTSPYAITEVTRQQANPYVSDNAIDVYSMAKLSQFNSNGTLYFYTYNEPISFQIIQGGVILKSSADAVALTTDEISMLRGLSFFNATDINLVTDAPTINGAYVTGVGKIPFAHIANAGRNYNIQTTKGTAAKKWRWMIQYPIDSSDYTDCVYDSSPTQPTITSPTIITTAPITTAPGSTYSSTNLYIMHNGLSSTGTSIDFGTTDAELIGYHQPVANFDQYAINITSWASIKANNPYTNNILDYTEDAVNGKFKSIYIDSATIAAAIRYRIWQLTAIDVQITTPYNGAELVDFIHGLYSTYMNRIPELRGLVYWIEDIIIRGRSKQDVENDFITIRDGYRSRYGGTTFDYHWNTTNVVISNYSIPTVPGPYDFFGFVFLRPSSMLKNQNYYLEDIVDSSAGESSNIETNNNPTWITQTYYDPSLTTKTRFFEVYSVSYDVIKRGMSKRVGRSIPASDVYTILIPIYNTYWNVPIRGTTLTGGLGRPPDIDGYTYWLKKYYVEGLDLNTVITAMFNNAEPSVESGGTLSLREQGTVSRLCTLTVDTRVVDTAIYGARKSAVDTTTIIIKKTESTATVNTVDTVIVASNDGGDISSYDSGATGVGGSALDSGTAADWS